MSSQERYEHFVITRYFVRFFERAEGDNTPLKVDPAWLDSRVQLFKTYCLPSVMAQSDADFRWHIYFDQDFPEAYLAPIRALIRPYPNIEIKMCATFTAETVRKAIADELKPETRWVLTTRLDNDDGWNRDFVKNLHAQLTFDRREFLNFPIGLIYYAGNVYLYRHASNAFISFLEPREDFVTVWCGAHAFLSRVAPVRQLEPFPAFVQVIHERTKSNKPRGVRVHRVLALTGFEAIPALSEAASSDTDAGILWHNLTSASTWAARDRAVELVRSAARRVVRTGIGGAVVAKALRPLTVDF
jgi:hypothetical protein